MSDKGGGSSVLTSPATFSMTIRNNKRMDDTGSSTVLTKTADISVTD